ncbi:MAG: Gfo/Idh/MocA family oxidoreductase [Clostridiales bacterium]|jgi:predicted dehydrogenase|nr:Gfo/Idh/MocA family oxidoreductase [Clostridiales bacterium]
MHDNLKAPVLLAGCGYMAAEYAKVLDALNAPYICVGRGEQSAKRFSEAMSHDVIVGGLEKYVNENEAPETAVVAVNIDSLAESTKLLIKAGAKKILVEKPAGITVDEIKDVANTAKEYGANVYVAYNRRFHASTIAAEKIIEQDGGVKSFYFDFTEWLHLFDDDRLKASVCKNLIFANSSHVLDLAFYLGGVPKKMDCYVNGEASWYGEADIYCGSGITRNDALFSYHANWNGPGRWFLEIVTNHHKLIFKPLEQLHIQKMKTVAIEKESIDDSLDTMYKPGLYLQTKAFLFDSDNGRLLTVHNQLENALLYKKIANGN